MTDGALRDLEFDLSGVGVRLSGLPEAISSLLESSWHGFATERATSRVLDIRVEARPVEPFSGTFDPKAMRAEISPENARYEMPEGTVEVDARGKGHGHIAATGGLGGEKQGQKYSSHQSEYSGNVLRKIRAPA